jgi:hypothetical protein
MEDTMILKPPLRRCFSVLGIVLGAVLVHLTFASPAHAGDLGFPYGGYGYPAGGYGCGNNCGCGYHCGCGVRCYPSLGNVIERHYVVRSYYERRVPTCCGYGGYGGYGGGGYGGYGGGFGGGYGGGGFGGGYGRGGFGYGGYYPSAYAEVGPPPAPIPYGGGGYGYGY